MKVCFNACVAPAKRKQAIVIPIYFRRNCCEALAVYFVQTVTFRTKQVNRTCESVVKKATASAAPARGEHAEPPPAQKGCSNYAMPAPTSASSRARVVISCGSSAPHISATMIFIAYEISSYPFWFQPVVSTCVLAGVFFPKECFFQRTLLSMLVTFTSSPP